MVTYVTLAFRIFPATGKQYVITLSDSEAPLAWGYGARRDAIPLSLHEQRRFRDSMKKLDIPETDWGFVHLRK